MSLNLSFSLTHRSLLTSQGRESRLCCRIFCLFSCSPGRGFSSRTFSRLCGICRSHLCRRGRGPSASVATSAAILRAVSLDVARLTASEAVVIAGRVVSAEGSTSAATSVVAGVALRSSVSRVRSSRYLIRTSVVLTSDVCRFCSWSV